MALNLEPRDYGMEAKQSSGPNRKNLVPCSLWGYLVTSSGISSCHKLEQVLMSPGMRGRIGTQHPPVYVCDDLVQNLELPGRQVSGRAGGRVW